ncbi:MAG: isocitrate dehydrogenase, partial [Phycisphaerales bacterium]|nr:isocitrate dehydrogenase [Phycisphaerales bacterium]
VLDFAEFIPVDMGASEFAKGNSRGMSDQAIRTVEDCGVLFKGPFETPKGGGGKSVNVTARKLWNTYANLRHFVTLPGVETVFSRAGTPLNFYIVRENIEDTYGGVEHRLTADSVQCKRIITAPGSDQVCRFAFATARNLGIKKVYCGHKANIMKMTDGLFLERFKAAAAEHPQIEHGDVIVDALCMNLVLKPQQYQMIVLPNLQGDIVSDLAAGLVGGLGFAPSANIGRHISIFEAVHGTAPDIAGRGIANPTALVLSGLMMLRHLGLYRHAAIIENALLTALEQGVHTGDFGHGGVAGRPPQPSLGSRQYISAIIDRLGASPTMTPATLVPDATAPSRRTPARPPFPQLIRTTPTLPAGTTQVSGADIYIEVQAPTPPAEFAAAVSLSADGSPFMLTFVSNRGTQVWPSGSVYTEVTDYYRARFELRPGMAAGQHDAISLVSRLAERYLISTYELLRTFDGAVGYSKAQGQ